MTAYERRTKQAEAIAGAAHNFDARHDDIFREDVLGTGAMATIPVDASLHLLSPVGDDARTEDFEDAEPPCCPVCGGPVEEMLRNYQPFTACTESLADGANCTWFRRGKIADALRAAKEEAEKADTANDAGYDDLLSDRAYSQVPYERAPAPAKPAAKQTQKRPASRR